MGKAAIDQLVFTQEGLCRVCYTCVRECPARAIRIENGQAMVNNYRCIGCGNCVKVCSQMAKDYLRFTSDVSRLLKSDEEVVALVAPSFASEFDEYKDYKLFVGLLKELGFSKVCEVAFGADLVAREYDSLCTTHRQGGYISSDCPAIVYYIQHYHPELVQYLVPVVSPMIASHRVVRQKYGDHVKTVFIGPCIAKKAESTEVDFVITFNELRALLRTRNVNQNDIKPIDFDPPHAGAGAIFPISRGLLHNLSLEEDISTDNVIVAEGKNGFREAIHEFENGLMNVQLLEVLCCDGCIMGPGTSDPREGKFAKRIKLSSYVNQKTGALDVVEFEKDIAEFGDMDLSRSFEPKDRRIKLPTREEIEKVLISLGKFSSKDHLNCGACGYETCEEHAIAVAQGFAEQEMCLPETIEKLHKSIEELNISNDKLVSAQQALKQQEKLAHMGQLSAGIAHELNNPIGVILMYTNILMDECDKDSDIYEDLRLIADQSERCKNIVSGLLNFARRNQVKFDEVNVVELVNKSLSSLIFKSNVKVSIRSFVANPVFECDIEQMIQVISNLAKNAAEAMEEIGGEIYIQMDDDKESVSIKVKDNGKGIGQEHIDKIFDPFYTTKGIGKGTGLGLATIYGIIKMHTGKIEVTSNADPEKGPTGTEFSIFLPRKGTKQVTN
jgi:signal transduction histidine kinase/iron only hydrogenase large subunit-like protein